MSTEPWNQEDLDLLSEAFKMGSDYMKEARAKEAKARAEQEALNGGPGDSRIVPVSDLGRGLRDLAHHAQKSKRR